VWLSPTKYRRKPGETEHRVADGPMHGCHPAETVS
jgi:hypothetical protein